MADTDNTLPKRQQAGKRRTKHAHLLQYHDFPLSPPVPTRRWYKTIKGCRYYFGKLDDPQAKRP